MEPATLEAADTDPSPLSSNSCAQEVESNPRYLIIYNISKRKNIQKLLSVAVAYRFNVALVGSQAFAARYSRCFDEIKGMYKESLADAGTSRSGCTGESIVLVNTQCNC